MSNDGKQETGNGGKSLLLFQLGPVQEFIAQARSTRDMWSGSYLLSWLMAHAIIAVVQKGNLKNDDVVFPSLDNNPLVLALRDPRAPVSSELALIPNLPNRFLVVVPNERAKDLAEVAKQAIKDELANIGNAVWNCILTHGGQPGWRTRWDAQIKAFPQISFAFTPWDATTTWRMAYKRVNELLAARRNTRDFAQWETVDEAAVKDSLSGKEECIGDETFWTNLQKKNPSLFKTKGHVHGAMNLIKRLWMHVEDIASDSDISYLSDKLNFTDKELWKSLKIRDLQKIADENKNGGSYIAVLAMDGDHMGTILSGPNDNEPMSHHANVSKTLSKYALNHVLKIVRDDHQGHLVYAGGDDVLALLPSDRAIACARSLRQAFKNVGQDYGFDASCGIAIGHCNSPLQMLVKEARKAEHRAKDKYGRSAVAFTVYKRSGEIIKWGTKWDGGTLELMSEITELTSDDRLSGRFPYALAELLAPYALKDTNDAMKPVIQTEVRHVLGRQGSGMGSGEREKLAQKIDTYLDSTSSHLEDFINLFLVETFINRAREEN